MILISSLIAISENLKHDFEIFVSIKAFILDHDINGILYVVLHVQQISCFKGKRQKSKMSEIA